MKINPAIIITSPEHSNQAHSNQVRSKQNGSAHVLVHISLTFMFVALSSATYADYRDATNALKAKKYNAAAQEFKQLAILGYGRATMAYANMLVKQTATDEIGASAWYALAANQGREKAIRQKIKLTKGMTSEQLERHKDEVNNLLSHYGVDALRRELLPENGGTRPQPFNTIDTKELEYPKEFRADPVIRVVELRFEVDNQGNIRNPILTREVDEPFVREALKYLRKQTWRSNNQCCREIRLTFTNDDTLEQYGSARLLKKLRKRAEHGSPYRKYYYGFAQELSESLDYKYSSLDSNRWFLEAAQGGYAKAQYIVGFRTLTGHTMTIDRSKALKWLKLAAEQNHPGANYLLALDHAQPLPEAARTYLKTAAQEGYSSAQLLEAMWLARDGDKQAAQTLLDSVTSHRDETTLLIAKAVVDYHADGTDWQGLLNRAIQTGLQYGFDKSFDQQVKQEFAAFTQTPSISRGPN